MRFGRGGSRAERLEAPARPIYICMNVCVCVRERELEKSCILREKFFNKFIMCVSNNLIGQNVTSNKKTTSLVNILTLHGKTQQPAILIATCEDEV